MRRSSRPRPTSGICTFPTARSCARRRRSADAATGHWQAVKDLESGELLRGHDGQLWPVESVTATTELAPVYNCRIAEYHTYFVQAPAGGAWLWAHNDCHHIVSRYGNTKRGWTVNWTKKSQALLKKGKIGVNSKLNKVHVNPHRGPHPELYHQRVFERLDQAAGRRTGQALHDALERELNASRGTWYGIHTR